MQSTTSSKREINYSGLDQLLREQCARTANPPSIDTVKLLIHLKANIEARDDTRDSESSLFHWTPIMSASYNGHSTLVNVLIENGANINAHSPVDNTALQLACGEGHLQIVRMLVEAKADVNVQAKFGHVTALITACVHGHHDIAKVLIGAGANLDRMTRHGRSTALMIAAENGDAKMVRLLIEAKADQDLRDARHRTAEEIALTRGHHEVMKVFRNYRRSSL